MRAPLYRTPCPPLRSDNPRHGLLGLLAPPVAAASPPFSSRRRQRNEPPPLCWWAAMPSCRVQRCSKSFARNSSPRSAVPVRAAAGAASLPLLRALLSPLPTGNESVACGPATLPRVAPSATCNTTRRPCFRNCAATSRARKDMREPSTHTTVVVLCMGMRPSEPTQRCVAPTRAFPNAAKDGAHGSGDVVASASRLESLSSGVCAMKVRSAWSTALEMASGTMASMISIVPCGSVPIRVKVTEKPGFPPTPSIAERSTPTPLAMARAAGGVFFI